ncbi:uncharacterized protein PHACADRAFT_32679 [Phanerochaete carnosa HHB-10118-sp]|uniref:Uncharacterized protein n=1 Tax=Phanerochaete carnosa (strain HHB-10118-sp) TaxID=650164 RepID=K5WK76_PHACS|nr:uncharacterized protein PHACADRAFT_32679 [Phanerochaete carnosa HHB-10118-sp]EKM50672.1 hypothetical protein PHACADRAFT_32679 [Phanerochaete carnosa HHB-10118-sp]
MPRITSRSTVLAKDHMTYKKDQQPRKCFSNSAQPATSPSSFSHIKPHIQGHASMPLSDFINFKILEHAKELIPLLEAVHTRFAAVFMCLNTDAADQVPCGDADKCWKMWNEFQDLYEGFAWRAKYWNSKQWRNLRGALKRMYKVKLIGLESRLPEICKELAEKQFSFPS